MIPSFISHPDFAVLSPLPVFHKEHATAEGAVPPAELQNKHILYRRAVEIGRFGRAVLQSSADDYYKLYIN
ncbi:MAG: hypothetical protein IJW62_05395 [Clostridia bacterium]|nr:hypothetical protein [Clostridia bacterium]